MLSNHFNSSFNNLLGSSNSDCMKDLLNVTQNDLFETNSKNVTNCFEGLNKYKNLSSLLEEDSVFDSPYQRVLFNNSARDSYQDVSLHGSSSNIIQDGLQRLAVKDFDPSTSFGHSKTNEKDINISDLINSPLLNSGTNQKNGNIYQAIESCNSVTENSTSLFTQIEHKSVGVSNEGKTFVQRASMSQDSEENSDIVLLKKSKSDKTDKVSPQIELLLKKIPHLNILFDIKCKIGEGSFSTVFLGTLKNVPPGAGERQFAIKYLIPTILPSRAERELRCMQDMGGKDNVVGVELCLRQEESVVFVMPYLPHKRFSEYILDLSVDEVRNYMKNLLLALQRVHSFNIIHRDIKPSNFLYDRENKKFLLIDFGLSQPGCVPVENEHSVSKKRKLTSSEDTESMLTPEQPRKRVALQPRSTNEQNVNTFKKNAYNKTATCTSDFNRNPFLPKDIYNCEKSPHKSSKTAETENTPPRAKRSPSSVLKDNMQKYFPRSRSVCFLSESIRKKLFDENKLHPNHSSIVRSLSFPASSPPSSSSSQKFQTLLPGNSPFSNSGSSFIRVQDSQVKTHIPYLMGPKESQNKKSLFCKPAPPVSSPVICCSCFGKPQVCSVCLKKKKLVAPRAGTPGFRPPEVLLKCTHQTTAVDMWAAGVVLLCILAGCYPFFRSPDDLTALTEIMVVFGSEEVKKVAAKLGRNLQCSEEKKPLCLKKLCIRVRRNRQKQNDVPVPDCRKCPVCLQRIEADGCLCLGNHIPTSTDTDGVPNFPDSAYDLLNRLLDLDPNTRITASNALSHPFILGY